jgi:hypothetical protein
MFSKRNKIHDPKDQANTLLRILRIRLNQARHQLKKMKVEDEIYFILDKKKKSHRLSFKQNVRLTKVQKCTVTHSFGLYLTQKKKNYNGTSMIVWKSDFQYIWKVERLDFYDWDYEMSAKYKTLTSSLFNLI